MFAGTTITIADKDYIVPPVSLGQLRNGVMTKMKEHDVMLAEGKNWEAMVMRGEIILEALQRNYPDFDADTLFGYLDAGNVSKIWLAVLGLSGFTPGEEQAAMTEISGT